MTTQVFHGPLGIWPWPLVNVVLSWIGAWSSSQKTATTASSSKAKNLEVWEWTDYHGRKRSITVHRMAETSGGE